MRTKLFALLVCLFSAPALAQAYPGTSANSPAHVTGDTGMTPIITQGGTGTNGISASTGSGTYTGPNPQPMGGPVVTILNNATVATGGAVGPIYLTNAAFNQYDLLIDITGSRGVGPLTFSIAEVDPGSTGTTVGKTITGVALGTSQTATATSQILTITDVHTSTLKVSWSVTGTFTGVNALLIGREGGTQHFCNGAPQSVAGTSVSANTATSIPLTVGACNWLICTVDINGFVGTSGTASATSPLWPNRMITYFYSMTMTTWFIYPSANGTCWAATLGE